MKVLIVEDEKYARESLAQVLAAVAPEIQIIGATESIKETVSWLSTKAADLIFMDIHLADGLSFKIFEQVDVLTPIIFTTAFDQCALQAFKVNSIDYLLKPIDEEELKKALEKFQSTQVSSGMDYHLLAKKMEELTQRSFQERFLVSRGDKIMSTTIDQVAYFEGEDRYVYLIRKDGSRYIIDYKLSELEEVLDPKYFFRLNRSFITHFGSIDRIITLSKSRLKVELSPRARREIFVSAANNRAFKMWLNQ